LSDKGIILFIVLAFVLFNIVFSLQSRLAYRLSDVLGFASIFRWGRGWYRIVGDNSSWKWKSVLFHLGLFVATVVMAIIGVVPIMLVTMWVSEHL
jgi:hypothetical protein